MRAVAFILFLFVFVAMTYDLIIIGGGPAGTAAGVYAARKQLTTLLITSEFGGQSTVSEDIQNWIGTVSISGAALANSLKAHLEAYRGEFVTVREGVRVTQATKGPDALFTVTTDDGQTYTTRTILIASGATRKKLDVPGAKEFDNKGLTYCASCDGPVYSGMDVAVIGSGNAGFETAAQLLAYVKSVTLLNKNANFRADPITVQKVLAHPNMRALNNASTTEIIGDTFVSGLRYKNLETNTEETLAVHGVFVEIGVLPSSDFAIGLVELDAYNRIKTDPRNQHTSTPGVWAAGDCTDELYHQNNIAAGDAVKALEDIYVYLKAR